ncbi:hypothetical protein EYZ11_003402 [Aspergillus tanneri]|uniref:Uncharacterized protein n=1 Tax=Aspergillus tanneri TaxID=1220188 RepID=A0A4S3JNA4_9EURO|nr:hypothetical protein EYZ11_003402 [Aspergillus tanneri]
MGAQVSARLLFYTSVQMLPSSPDAPSMPICAEANLSELHGYKFLSLKQGDSRECALKKIAITEHFLLAVAKTRTLR